MDAFYASVEQRDNPEWKGCPLIVGGDPQSRAVVASASYEARRFGVRSAMSCAQARRLCPQAIFVRPRISHYLEVSRQIREIFYSVTRWVEPLSLDEAYLDVTENYLDEPFASRVARCVQERLFLELQLTASAGVGPNKFIAKVASDLKKPRGLVIVRPDQVMAFIEKLPIEKLWGVGPATAKKLHEHGYWTTADVRKRTEGELEALLGSYGKFIFGLAHGIDPRKVEIERESKSCGSERTFERDVLDVDVLELKLRALSKEIAEELNRLGRPGRTVTLKLRYSDFETITRSRTLGRYLRTGDSIFTVAFELLRINTEVGERAVRLIGVTVSGLLREDEPEQMVFDFFNE